MNSWTKRAIGVAALAGGLLALGAGSASAEQASTSASVRIGAAPTAEVRLCGGGATLSGLLGRCGGQAGSGSDSTTVRADGSSVRVRLSGLGSARGLLETRPDRPRATVSGRVAIPRHARLAADVSTDPDPRASVKAELADPSVRALDPAGPSAAAKVAIMLAREGITDGADAAVDVDLGDPSAAVDAAIGVGGEDPAADADVTASVDLGSLPATADAAITLGHDDTATGADAAVELGLGDAADPAAGTADATLALGLPELADPVAAAADATVAVGLPGLAVPGLDGGVPTLPAPVGDGAVDGLLGGIETPVLGVGDLVPSTAGTICVGDCGADTGTGGSGGRPEPTQPSPTPPAADGGTGSQDTGTAGIRSPDGTGATGTSGRLAGAAGDAGATFARLRSALGGAAGGSLAFTGAASDLLAFMALGLLMVGALLLRAARPARVTERR